MQVANKGGAFDSTNRETPEERAKRHEERRERKKLEKALGAASA